MTESGIVIEVKLVQPSKTPPLIFVTELPIVTEVKPIQRKKAHALIFVTELGITTEVKLMQSSKAFCPGGEQKLPSAFALGLR